MSDFNITILNKGEIVNSTYDVQFFIGEGAFGEVYRVKHKFLETQVLKVFKEDYVKGTDLAIVTAEAKILSKLTHQNIVRVFETNSFIKGDKTFYYITMGFVSGETLNQLLTRKIKLPIELAVRIVIDILSGLKYVQEQKNKIVHRDLNPDNILLSYEKDIPTALISDFGLAQSIDQLSKICGAAGRYLYFAPECFLGTYLPTSDIFSVGIILYKMITGMHPWEYDIDFSENSKDEIATKIISKRREKVTPPSFHNSESNDDLDKIILKSLEKNIEKRYSTASEFLVDIYNYNFLHTPIPK
jgi:serine/threonine protein kinase